MTSAAPAAIAAINAVEAVMRDHRGRLLAALIARLRNFQLAEDALQEAMISAISHWGRAGLPNSPEGWLLRVALRKAIDGLRKDTRESRKSLDQAILARDEADDMETEAIPDDRLRLIFTCCHPALEEKSRVALTLRSLCGLTTPQVAAAFLDAEPTMGQRLSRAKAKIAAAGIPFTIPDPEDWPDRLNSVLTVVYLIFTTGYTNGPVQGHDLCHEALYLARLVVLLAPEDAEAEGCLALMLLTHARAKARLDAAGQTIALAEQDRRLWDAGMIAEGLALTEHALRRGRPGPFQIKAAIAACHADPAGADWPQIALLYRELMRHEPTPVVRLNHAVAVAETAAGPATGLQLLQSLSGDLDGFQPFHAAEADLLARAGRYAESLRAYARAISLAGNPGDAAFLAKRRDSLPLSAAARKADPQM